MSEIIFSQLTPGQFETLIERSVTRALQTIQPHDNPGTRHDSQEELLTVTQAAEYLKLKTNTIYVLTSQRRIPHSKNGKRVLFSKKELCEWVKSGRRKTHEELEAEAVAYVSNNPLIKKG